MTARSPWKMAENRTLIDVPYVDRRVYVNARSVSTCLYAILPFNVSVKMEIIDTAVLII